MDNQIERTAYKYGLVLASLCFIIGVLVGLMIAYLLIIHGIEIIGTSFKVENVNMTIQLNESQIIDAINRTRQP